MRNGRPMVLPPGAPPRRRKASADPRGHVCPHGDGPRDAHPTERASAMLDGVMQSLHSGPCLLKASLFWRSEPW